MLTILTSLVIGLIYMSLFVALYSSYIYIYTHFYLYLNLSLSLSLSEMELCI